MYITYLLDNINDADNEEYSTINFAINLLLFLWGERVKKCYSVIIYGVGVWSH